MRGNVFSVFVYSLYHIMRSIVFRCFGLLWVALGCFRLLWDASGAFRLLVGVSAWFGVLWKTSGYFVKRARIVGDACLDCCFGVFWCALGCFWVQCDAFGVLWRLMVLWDAPTSSWGPGLLNPQAPRARGALAS